MRQNLIESSEVVTQQEGEEESGDRSTYVQKRIDFQKIILKTTCVPVGPVPNASSPISTFAPSMRFTSIIARP